MHVRVTVDNILGVDVCQFAAYVISEPGSGVTAYWLLSSYVMPAFGFLLLLLLLLCVQPLISNSTRLVVMSGGPQSL